MATSLAPNNDAVFYVTAVAGPTVSGGTLYNLTTNIPAADSTFYGYDFTRWTIRLSYLGTLTNNGTGAVDQSFEVIVDSGYNSASTGYRVLQVNINPTDASTVHNNPTPDGTSYPNGYSTQLPGQYLLVAAANSTALNATCPFILDGRWLRAFNGAGMTTNAVHGNFRYNGIDPNAAVTPGMDEDYDAADLENWFLALQSADGSVMIPSFHRPAAIRLDAANKTSDWSRDVPNGWTFDMSRILRPVAADGHDANTFRDLVPDSSGKITYDVDNDGDGQTDSVWVDLGYPARRNAQGQLYKPLFSFMVIGLNGRIPLNTAGNLAGGRGLGSAHASHLGNSVSEVDPTYGLQNAFDSATLDRTMAYTAPVYPAPIVGQASNTQVDSGSHDVRTTQLRNLLTGTKPQDSEA